MPLSRLHLYLLLCSRFLFVPLFLATGITSTVYANDIAQPPLWYTARFQFASTTISPGITVQAGNGQIVFRNTTTTPLYILRLSSSDLIEKTDLPIKPPAIRSATIKLIKNQVWYWNDYARTWHAPRNESMAFSPYDITLTEYFANFHIDVTKSLDRPSHPIIPPPQSAMLQIIVGRSLERIPIDLIHDLNPDYDRQVQFFNESEQRDQSIRFLVGILAVAVIVVYCLVCIAGISVVVISVKWVTRRWNARPNASGERRDEW